MRIAFVGSQSCGKTELIETFKKYWPMYKSPEKTYRDIIKEKNLSINEEGNLESQKIIRDSLVDQAILSSDEKYSVSDRCVLDNLVYSYWLYDKGKFGEITPEVDKFMNDTQVIVQHTLSFYDIIFYLPVDFSIPLKDGKDTRSNSEEYRKEIDELFRSVWESYLENSGAIFPLENSPAMIPLEGDLDQKIKTIKEYLDDDGELILTTQSVFQDLADLELPDTLLKQVNLKK